MIHVAPFTGRVWRILFETRAQCALDPAGAPEGRFHYGEQQAIYTSLSREGAGVAIGRYVASGDTARVIVPLDVRFARVADLRGMAAASVVWQDRRAEGKPAPTWDLSDAARAEGAQALLYSSRSRPELCHLAVFGQGTGATLVQAGPAEPWPGP